MYNKHLDIGLEIHVQLATKTKLFSRAPVVIDGEPNSAVAPLDIGLPGAMPALNERAVELATTLAIALNGKIQKVSYFDRKHYNYLDLPLGYQITQGFVPFCKGGMIILPDGKEIKLSSMHLECDAGKLKYDNNYVYIDYNRCGVPLVEMVFTPMLHTVEDVISTIREVRHILRYTGVSKGDMESGHLRVDVNMSVRDSIDAPLGVRTEIKNLNCFKSIREAITYEYETQHHKKTIIQYTKGYDPERGETYIMREKESMNDYRYLRDENIPPLYIPNALIKKIKDNLVELPAAKRNRYKQYCSDATVEVLITHPRLGDSLDQVPKELKNITANLLTNDLINHCTKNEKEITVNDKNLKNILEYYKNGDISMDIIKKKLIFLIVNDEEDAIEYIRNKKLLLIKDSTTIQQHIDFILENNQEILLRYRQGKIKLLNVLIGKIMGRAGGRLDPQQLKKMLLTSISIVK